MTIEFLEAATVEAEEALEYYEQRQPGLGAAFRSAIEMALARIEARPLGMPLIDGRSRKCRLRRFPYNLIYRVLDDRILIIAVAHDRRKPDYWRERVG
jgi:mRNA-degrading endonuclease RelE of RelBE toxin-antitoxin system